MTRTTVDNFQDILDSRDVIERIQELEDELEALETEDEKTAFNESEEGQELKALKALADEASDSPDWPYGEALIRDSYFTEYAEQLAEDIGAINPDASWPNTCIDWDQAARELKMDYMSVDFDGIEYWIRS